MNLIDNWVFVLVAVLAAASMLIVFNWRMAIAFSRSTVVGAAPEAVWRAVDHLDGDLSWHQDLDRIERLGGTPPVIARHHVLTRDDGSSTGWCLKLEVVERTEGRRIVLRRVGIEGLGTADRLLGIAVALEPAPGGTRVTWREEWGPRSLTGIMLAHSEVAQQLARLKRFCETGSVKGHRSHLATGLITAASMLATAAAFSVVLGWQLGLIFVVLLALHEAGHLVSFRMIGQPHGRIVFMPFLGGVAVSRVPHVRLADDVFCALMGAGLSVLGLVPAMAAAWFDVGGETFRSIAYATAALTGAINLLNLLPVFPLDGGRVVRAMAQSLAPRHVRLLMLAVAGLVGLAGAWWMNPVVIAIAVVAFFQSTRLGPANAGLTPMSLTAAGLMTLAYGALALAHGAALWAFWPALV